jgi:hypothetical protein
MRRVSAMLAFFTIFTLAVAMAVPAYADPGNGNNSPPPGQGNGNGNGNNGNGNGNNGNGNGNNGNAGGSNAGGNGNGAGQNGSPNGANGDVKIHDWPDHKNSSEMANDPKVCRFEIHGFNFDPGQTGMWWIQEHKWGSGDKSKAVLTNSYSADGSGNWTQGPFTLDNGHYKLFVEMSHEAGNSGRTVVTEKHKVFKVECPPTQAGGTQGGGGEQGGQSGGGEQGGQSGGGEQGGQGSVGEQGGGGQQQGQQQGGQAVAGFEQAPQAGVSPIVETAPMTFEQAVANQQAQAALAAQAQLAAQAPAVAAQAAVPGAVAGAEMAPIAQLPSTSTAVDGIIPILAALSPFAFLVLRKRM